MKECETSAIYPAPSPMSRPKGTPTLGSLHDLVPKLMAHVGGGGGGGRGATLHSTSYEFWHPVSQRSPLEGSVGAHVAPAKPRQMHQEKHIVLAGPGLSTWI